MATLDNTDFNQTYLHKLHILTNSLDRLFDQTLRMYACPGLSQLMLMLIVAKQSPISSAAIAKSLDISRAAVSRQIDIALEDSRIEMSSVAGDKRTQLVTLTKKGHESAQKSIEILDRHLFSIFDQQDTQTSLMNHIDMLTKNTKTVLQEQVLKRPAQKQLTKGSEL